MALIYASAVNKRMNAPKKKRSMGSDMDASYCSSVHSRQRSNDSSVSQSIDGMTKSQRKRSTSQHSSTPTSINNITPPPTLNSSASANGLVRKDSLSSERSHRNHVKRSKTSVSDVKRKNTSVHPPSTNQLRVRSRKISTPIMSQSMVIEPCSNCNNGKEKSLRKSLAKKRMGQESSDPEERMCLAASDESSDVNDEEDVSSRRRSVSMDVNNTKSNEYEDLLGDKRRQSQSVRVSTFQKMCSKFAKWKLARQESKETEI
ncbi:unnamed protein product [Bursaphelenchus okinawaensis]|uniref:Uncharacterized protein n=1 Tax=Bursaphelenchus okinawaensis TaxID=465554 RepID=A0A811KLM9_9BILA|nr:unnamed protein product [Bursaphelenchus okinawaensis]CAG9106293.1 unnamed protein product [Bursaphelenchus okinawaensis]